MLPRREEAVGLANYAELVADDIFWRAVRNTITWACTSPLVEVSIALLLALALYARVPGARFFRVAWFTPVLMSYVVVGILWLWIYNFDWGPVNVALRALGLGGWTKAWLGDPKTALPSLIFVTSWMWVGFNMVVLLAALHSLPKEVIEAAELDNCGWGGKLVFVILPLIRATLLNLIVLSFIGKMKIFDLVWITTKGNPLWATETVSTYVYKRAFEWTTFDLGYPSTIAAVWFVIVLAAVLTLTWAVPAAREARVLRRRMPALKRALLLLLLCLYTSFAAGPFVWAAMMSLRTTTEIHRNHFGLPSPAHWEKFSEAWFNSNYGIYFANSSQIVVSRRPDPDARRLDGRALPGPLQVPAQPRDLLHPVLDHHLPPADHHHLAVPDPGAVRALQHQGRPDAGLCGDPAAAHDLHPRELLCAHPLGPVRRRAHGRLFGLGDLLARELCRSRCRPWRPR